jgi:hypothetical protein
MVSSAPVPAVATCLALALAFAPVPVATETPAGPPSSPREVDPAAPDGVAWPADRELAEPTAEVSPPAVGDEMPDDAVDDDEVVDDDSEAPGYDPLRDSPEGLQAHRRIGGGIALTIVGTVLTIGAIALGRTDPCRPLAGNSCQAGARNRAAWVIGVPGAAILGGGITLLTLGLLKRQRILAGISASRTSGGVVLSGRF